jgi:hypothetical protein
MTRPLTAIATALAILTTTTAHAGDVSLTRPIEAGTLHEHGADVVIYYTPEGDALKVVTTYAKTTAPDQPQRMIMLMGDGDRVSFHLPGLPETRYTYARAGETVRVFTRETVRLAQTAK